MKRSPASRALLEGMGLRLDDAAVVRPLDALIVIALLLSSTAWLLIAFAGLEPLRDLLDSRIGRWTAGLTSVASVAAVTRALRDRERL